MQTGLAYRPLCMHPRPRHRSRMRYKIASHPFPIKSPEGGLPLLPDNTDEPDPRQGEEEGWLGCR